MSRFKLTEKFLEKYQTVRPQWGPVGEVTYYRTYSRTKEDGTNEQWWETVQRVVEGTFSIQKEHCEKLRLPWKQAKATKSAQKMYDKIFMFKFLPPGRGLWMMGTKFIYERGSASLNSCAFVGTEDLKYKGAQPFAFMMDALMNGVGVGFDTMGAGTVSIRAPKGSEAYQIPDTREGWVEATKRVIEAYLEGGKIPILDYSLIRSYGEPISGFGGIASGPAPLIELHENIRKLLDARIGWDISSGDIVDLMNYIGKCVIAGNVRRSAEIALGLPDDIEYRHLKDPVLNLEELQDRRWASNNSILAKVGMDYGPVVESIAQNGEPGLIWLENMQHYARLVDNGDGQKDLGVRGVNPCFVGDTKIAVADGRGAVSLRQLTEEGKDVPVYSVDPDGIVEIKMGRNPRITGFNQELVKVVLDDDTEIIVTPNHEFRLLDGQSVNAVDLHEGDSLSRFTKRSERVVPGGKEYLRVYGNTTDRNKNKVFEHRMIAKFQAQRMSVMVKAEILKFYKKFESETDLNTLWDGDTLLVVKHCESCGVKMLLSIGRREVSFCSRACVNKAPYQIEKRKQGQRVAFANKQRQVLHQQVMVFKDLIQTNGKVPFVKEWVDECAKRKIPHRIRHGSHTTNPYALKTFQQLKEVAVEYNHRVKRVEKLTTKENVYNITVDNNHTVGIVTKFNTESKACDGVFTFQCGEQSLESTELCCLVETFPSRHDSFEEYRETLKYAYMYAKTVTLVPTHWPESNAVMMKNRRIGTSQSGIIDAFAKFGRRTVLDWCDAGYTYMKGLDIIYSDWFCVPRSIKITSVKPSGTVSLLPGVSPGIHYPHSEWYIRRIRIAEDSPLIPILKSSGHYMEPDKRQARTIVVDFPTHVDYFSRRKREVTVWEQVVNAVDYQTYWSDNNVSITVTFKKEEAVDVVRVLEAFDDRLKAISFLPLDDHGYEQAPYEEITEEQYTKLMANQSDLDFSSLIIKASGDHYAYCDGDKCEILPEIGEENVQIKTQTI